MKRQKTLGLPNGLKRTVQFKETGGRRLRVFQRADVAGSVIVHDDTDLYIAPLQNISAGGVFVEDLVTIPEGRTVRVVVKSPKLEEPVQAVGAVVRIEKGRHHKQGLAIEFTSISSRSREMIQNCVFEARMETALKAA